MAIGIRPTNDFAFKKTFGSPKNKPALISLLNAILQRDVPIGDVVIENPYNPQDFHDDKLSVLDVKAIDESGAIYDIEIQLATRPGLMQRLVFYGCELFADQLRAGDDYTKLKPVVIIALLEESIWPESKQLHHRFILTDSDSGRQMENTLSVHTLELEKYNLSEADLAPASTLERWLFWLLYADDYEADRLLALFPDKDFQLASGTLIEISEMTEDKTMYDAREKAIRDQQWAINVARDEGLSLGLNQGKIEGKVEVIQVLQAILGIPVTNASDLGKRSLEELQVITADLQDMIQNRQHGR
jgi:predicted transposase/invertase (TIGR01784 family)